MNETLKKILSLVLAAVMVLSISLPCVFAEDGKNENTQTSEQGENPGEQTSENKILNVVYNPHDGDCRDYVITVTGSPLAVCLLNESGNTTTWARDFSGIKSIEKTEDGEVWTLNTKIAEGNTYRLYALYGVSDTSEYYPLVVSYGKHSYVDTVVPPTCTKGGYTEHKCECGSTYTTDPTNPVGHNKTTETKAADCDNAGYIKVVCKTCGETLENTVIPAKGHTWIDKVEKKADCHNEGLSVKRCAVCGKEHSRTVLKKTTHSWTSWQIVSDPTYSSPGMRTRTCKICGDIDNEEIPPLVEKVTGVTLSMNSISLRKGKSTTLYANVTPDNARYSAELVWSSSNSNIVSVDQNGLITAVKAGKATVTVATKDGKYSDSCEVVSDSIFIVIIRFLFGWLLG